MSSGCSHHASTWSSPYGSTRPPKIAEQKHSNVVTIY
jgi:hypothetical protein